MSIPYKKRKRTLGSRKNIKSRTKLSNRMRKSEMADRWLQENVQRWIGSWLDSRRRPKKKKKYITGQFSRRFLPPSLPLLPLSLSLSLSCPLSFLSPFWHPSSCPTIAPTYVAPSLYKRARATTCFLLSPPLDRVQRVPLHNPSTGSRPALFHTPFSLRCFLTCPFLQCVITYVHLRLFLLLFLFSVSPQLLTQLLSSRIGRTLSAEVA